MNGTTVATGALIMLTIALSVNITNTNTTANVSVSDWHIDGESTVTTTASGIADVESCPVELLDCQVEYAGDITVDLDVVDDQLQINPSFAMNSVNLIGTPIANATDTPSEVTSDLSSEVTSVTSEVTSEE